MEAYISKTRILLEREQEFISQRAHDDNEIRTAHNLREENEKLQLQLSEAQETAIKMEEALGVLGNQFSSGGPISRDQLVKAHKRIANLEVQLDVALKRTELSENKWSMAEKIESDVKERLNTVDKLYLETMEENMQLRDAEMDLRNSYEGGANREENCKNLQYIARMEEEAENLRRNTLKAETRTELATQQASDLIRIHAIDEKEKDILRAGMQELQMEGDEKLVIGKLHNHIVSLQISEANCSRKLEIVTAKCLKLESNVVQLERLVEMRDDKIYQMHLDSKNRVRILQGIVSDLRSRMCGVVLLTKHEVCTVNNNCRGLATSSNIYQSGK